MSVQIRTLLITSAFAVAAISQSVQSATFEATGIVNFFCDEAGRGLAALAFQDKANGVPLLRNMHSNPIGFLQRIDNEIIRAVYRQAQTESEAKDLGFRVCVILMVAR